jgi:flagellar biosynthesis protein FlhG
MHPLRVIAVTSGKGGVGKSHLSANLATLVAQQGQRVLLIDADAGLANLDVLMGVHPEKNLGHLLDGEALDQVLLQTPAGPWLLPASSGLQRLTRLLPDERNALFSVWDELAWRFDVLVLDCGPGIGADVLFFASVAHQVVLLVSAEPTSIADAAVMVQALHEDTAVRELLVVVNGTRTERNAHAVFAKLGATAAAQGSMQLHYLGSVPDDQNVRRATVVRQPLVLVAPHSPASRAFERVVTEILGRPAVAAGGGLQIGLERLMQRTGSDEDGGGLQVVGAS